MVSLSGETLGSCVVNVPDGIVSSVEFLLITLGSKDELDVFIVKLLWCEFLCHA